MIDIQKNITTNKYNLEKRTLKYSKNTIEFLKMVPITIYTNEIIKQLIRASTSIGANYIEANDSLGLKDFLMHLRICRKESKETIYWFKLIDLDDPTLKLKQQSLINEASQFVRIFSTMVNNTKQKFDSKL